MKLELVPLDKLSISKANMRDGRKPPDVSDILPTIRKRGVLVSLIVRPVSEPGHSVIDAGRRRYFAATKCWRWSRS
jgi:ParB family chromosome partitioning protein